MQPIDDLIARLEPGSVLDKILGTIYGHILGDVFGAPYEFKCANEISILPWSPTDWTEDTDMMLLVMLTLIDTNMMPDTHDFAQKLSVWATTGYESLGDTKPPAFNAAMRSVIASPDFCDDAIGAATTFWEKSGKKMALNGSLQRNSAIGTINDITEALTCSHEFSLCTHADPRCTIACSMHTVIINCLIYTCVQKPSDIDCLFRECVVDASTSDVELSNMCKLAYTRSVRELQLDDLGRASFVYKTLACSIYMLQVIKTALQHDRVPSFMKCMQMIAKQGGDTDANCATSGAVLGAYLGYTNLPHEWISSLPNLTWLNGIILEFISAMSRKRVMTVVADAPTITELPDDKPSGDKVHPNKPTDDTKNIQAVNTGIATSSDEVDDLAKALEDLGC